MVLKYKFDIPNLYDFQYIYIPNLLDGMYGCIDSEACNYEAGAVIDDQSCLYDNECSQCDDALNQNECMLIDGCMWMGDHCTENSGSCSQFSAQLECIAEPGCFWMGDHCMPGSTCFDPIAENFNPMAGATGLDDNTTCNYSPYLEFGCIYENANNYNPNANIDITDMFLNNKNAKELVYGSDVIIDATDNIESRQVIDQISKELDIPMVYGGLYRFEGQVSVFNVNGSPGYIELFPDTPSGGITCEDSGVLCMLPGIIGNIQALETLKLIIGIDPTLVGKILIYDAMNHKMRTIQL